MFYSCTPKNNVKCFTLFQHSLFFSPRKQEMLIYVQLYLKKKTFCCLLQRTWWSTSCECIRKVCSKTVFLWKPSPLSYLIMEHLTDLIGLWKWNVIVCETITSLLQHNSSVCMICTKQIELSVQHRTYLYDLYKTELSVKHYTSVWNDLH